MKIRFYLALAAAALVMTNCSQDEELVQGQQSSKGFIATIEGASRSDVTEAGAFSWTAGDKISVWNNIQFDVYANSIGNEGTFTPENEENAGTPTGYAIYPAGNHAISGSEVTINLPVTYTHGSTNAPMLATIENGSNTLSFKHLAGVMRFVVKNVPTKASSFVFTTTNNILTGSYTVVDGQICQDGENSVNNNNSVTITFTALTEAATQMVFYVPLPVGTYGDYTVAIKGEGVDLSHESTNVTNTIGRRTLLLMPEFSVENGELKKGAGNTIPVTQDQAAEISGNQNVTISTEGADTNEELDLNYTPQEGNASLNITDGSSETTPQDSKAKIKINPQGTTPVESLNINTPTLTAELGAGKYGTVNALTANQTLIIGSGVEIETLVLNGGNVELSADVAIKEFTVPAGVTTTLNLNNHTLTIDNPNSVHGLINKGKMTIGNGTIEFTGNTTQNGAAVYNAGQIQLDGVDITSNNGCFINYGDDTKKKLDGLTAEDATVTAVINGGTFKSTFCKSESHTLHRYAVTGFWYSNLIMDGTTITGSGGICADVSFATLTNVNAEHACQYGAHDLYVPCGNVTVTNCTFANAAAYSDDTYGKAVVNGVTYQNGTTAIPTWIEIDSAEELQSAFTNGGSYKLTTTIAVSGSLTATKPVALLMGDDVKLTINSGEITHGLINKSNMSIKGGAIEFTGNTTQNVAAVYNAGQIQLDGVDITSNNGCFINYGDDTKKKLDGLTAEDATVTAVINGGTFKSTFCKSESHTLHRYAVTGFWYSNLIMDGTTITGSGGICADVSFATLTNVNAEHACQYGAHDLYVPCGNVTVTNCTFANAAAYSDTTYGIAYVNGTPYNIPDGKTSVTTAIVLN